MRPGDAADEALEPLAGASSQHEGVRPSHDNEPFPDLPPDGVFEQVEHFAKSFNLTHKLGVFHKAATLIQGDSPPAQISDITPYELRALQLETDRKWQQPKIMYLTIVVTALGAMGQGWAQTSMNGANLYFPTAFGIGSDTPRDNLLVGLINSGIYLSNGLLGSWLVAPLNSLLGRRGAVFLAAIISLLSNLGGALTYNWQQLLFWRLLLGCALAVLSSTLNVYAAECAPSVIRGGLAVSWQAFCAFGIFIGFVANVAVYDLGPDAWRLQLAAPFLSSVPLLLLIYLCPESPAWHIKDNARYDLAFHSLCRLRNTDLQAARELYLSYLASARQLNTDALPPSYYRTLSELFTVPRIRHATLAAHAVMISQQLCGINIVSFYSSTIFLSSGSTVFGALLASTAFGLTNFVFAFPAVWCMDTLGRRALLLLTLPFMALTLLAAAMAFSIPESSPARFGLLAAMIYLFCAEYSPGLGPVPAAYSAEVFPLSHRELGTSSAVAVTNLWASALSLTFPQILSGLGNQGAFTLYAALNVVALALVFVFVRETKQMTLDELDAVFEVSTGRFVRWQVTEYVPWWVNRYVLRRDKMELRPLEGKYQALGQEDEGE